MLPVNVDGTADRDLRMATAADMLGLDPENLAWRLVGVWSHVTRQNSTLVSTRLVAGALRLKPAHVRKALCEAELATHDGDALDLAPLGSLYGKHTWYAELPGTAKAGGEARASTAERDESGRFASRDIGAEVLAVFADGQARKRSQLRKLIKCNSQRLVDAINALLVSGELVELPDRRLCRSEDAHRFRDSVPAESPENVPAEHAEHAERPENVPENTAEPFPDPAHSSALTLAPALALAQEAAAAAPAPAPAHTRARVPLEPFPERRETGTAGTAGKLDRYEQVRRRYEELGRQLDPRWEPLSIFRRIEKIRDKWPAADDTPVEKMLRALELLAVEAQERKRLGLQDPNVLYRAVWAENDALNIALGWGDDEDAARESARKQRAKQRRDESAEPQRKKLERLG